MRFDPAVAGEASDLATITSDGVSMPALKIPIRASAYPNNPTVQVELIANNNFGGVALGSPAVSRRDIYRVTNLGRLPLQIESLKCVDGAGTFSLDKLGAPVKLAREVVADPQDIFVNRGTIRVRHNSRLALTCPLISPKIVCEEGGLCFLRGFERPLFTAPGQVSELSGPGQWFVNKDFHGGTVRLTDGAVLEGAAKFSNVMFEGELHNYDWRYRKVDIGDVIGGYDPSVHILTNLTLNGGIYFHRPAQADNRAFCFSILVFSVWKARERSNSKATFLLLIR